MPAARLPAPLRRADLRSHTAKPAVAKRRAVVANLGVALVIVAFVAWAALAMGPSPSLYAAPAVASMRN